MEMHIVRIDCMGKEHTVSLMTKYFFWKFNLINWKSSISEEQIKNILECYVHQQLLEQFVSINEFGVYLLWDIDCISVSTGETALTDVLV